MACRSFSRALPSSLTRQLTSPATQRRSLTSASKLARTARITPFKPTFVATLQQTRGVKTIDFAGTKEVVYGDSSPAHPPPKQISASCTMLTGLQSARIGRETSFWCDHS